MIVKYLVIGVGLVVGFYVVAWCVVVILNAGIAQYCLVVAKKQVESEQGYDTSPAKGVVMSVEHSPEAEKNMRVFSKYQTCLLEKEEQLKIIEPVESVLFWYQ